MIVLVTNDDGIDARGLMPLVEVASELGHPWVVAPLEEQSSRSHALTMNMPLRIHERRQGWYAVSGTPADCVFLALNEILPERPGLVLSGINRGTNVGDDVHYSGTVAAAMEGCLLGLPSLAVSLAVDWKVPPEMHHWETGANYARLVARDILKHGLKALTLLNLNVPDLPPEQVKGVRVCRLSLRDYIPKVDSRMDLRANRYYWIGAEHRGFKDIDESDGPLLEQGYVTLSPLYLDMTAYDQITEIERWYSAHE